MAERGRRSRRGSEEEEYIDYDYRDSRGGRSGRGGGSDREDRDDRRGGGRRSGSGHRSDRDDDYDRRRGGGGSGRGSDREDDRGGGRRGGGGDYESDRHERGRSRERTRDRSGNRSREHSRGRGEGTRLDSCQEPGNRFQLKEKIGSGVCGDIYEAIDEQEGNRRVAIKIQKLTPESQSMIVEEYRVLRDLSGHPNIPEFYGVFRKNASKKTEFDSIWFVMQLCEGGPVIDLVRGLQVTDKRMREEHIAFILKETIKALCHLHENNIIHRDIKASNIMLTKEGEIKLVDFGLSRTIKGEQGKRHTCIGSPNWMAPEVVLSKSDGGRGYGSQVDVWAVGITAIELADGKPPFGDMHPTRTLFQIVTNPPPTFYRPANWSQTFNDFVAECLEKNPENRPMMVEIAEHPFLSDLPDNDYHITQEIKALASNVRDKGRRSKVTVEMIVNKNYLKTHQTVAPEKMIVEDLASLESLTEERVLDELNDRTLMGSFHTFVGDVLLILNPNEQQDIYNMTYHTKYQYKSRSDNSPHIYSVADSAYQDVLHHEEPQHILFAGESGSGKTTNMLHCIEHLMYLGKSLKDTGNRVMKAINLIHAFTNAATPLNPNSTRCVFETQTTYGSTGKASGAIFWVYQLEKWRVSTRDRNQSNFHIFYYLYDYLEANGNLRQYCLPQGRRMRYLRVYDLENNSRRRSFKVRNDPKGNARKFETIKDAFRMMELEQYFEPVCRVLAAILNIGDIRFIEGAHGGAEVHTLDTANAVAEILGIDRKKFTWALCNFCIVQKGGAVRKKHSCEEAKDIRDVIANTLYQRLVDWVVNNINERFSVSRTLFGDKFMINVMDLFGFECFSSNKLEQLVVNTMNEQLQCHYNQRIFAWEMQEMEEDEVPPENYHYYDNRKTIDQLMGKDEGFFFVLDEASKEGRNTEYIFDRIQHRQGESGNIKVLGAEEFAVAHYAGRITYDANEISEKNRDFIPPEMVETLRQSDKPLVKCLFLNKLTKAGNLTHEIQEKDKPKEKKHNIRSKWGALLVQETTKLRKYNTAEQGQHSQSRKPRTCAATFRTASLEILKSLCVGGGSGGTHFVRCVRTDLESTPRGFNRDVIRQQIRALAVLDTAKARQRGYPYRVSFQEFLRRYKFLAFDFDENVELTHENCRLLLVRLKMEGYVMGKSKVFLRYYNEEYLSRLYETQVKKIVKVQCMLRAFLARKTVAGKNQQNKVAKKAEAVKQQQVTSTEDASTDNRKSVMEKEMSQDDAALVLQKAYRGHQVRKDLNPEWNQETVDMMRYYVQKWRRKSIFQVLLLYRAARYQELVSFAQQVHLYNQAAVAKLQTYNERVPLDKIDRDECDPESFFGPTLHTPSVYKLPFSMNEEFPFYDTSHMIDVHEARRKRGSECSEMDEEAWDVPLQRRTKDFVRRNRKDVQCQTTNSPHRVINTNTGVHQTLIHTPFSRDPKVPVRCPPESTSTVRGSRTSTNYQPQPIVGSHNPKRHAAPQPPIKPNVHSTGSIRSRKKGPPPPIPTNQMPMKSYINNSSNNKNKKSNNDWNNENQSNGFRNNRPNPIEELRMIGRRNNNQESDDDPPFNFQAMLRKTPHQRASMKRTAVYESSNYGQSNSHQSNVVYQSKPGSNAGGNREFFYNKNSRQDSGEWSPNEMVRMSEKYGREEPSSSSSYSAKKNLDAISITTEIAPGIVVAGHVSDL